MFVPGALIQNSIVNSSVWKLKSSSEKLIDENAGDISYANIPSINSEPFIINRSTISSWIENYHRDLKPISVVESFNTFKNDSKRTVNYLAKEFELKKNAQQHARSSVSKTGVLNVNKLHTNSTTICSNV